MARSLSAEAPGHRQAEESSFGESRDHVMPKDPLLIRLSGVWLDNLNRYLACQGPDGKLAGVELKLH
jgi:hypothetical protein